MSAGNENMMYGNGLANNLRGNDFDNSIWGENGADTLRGLVGNDYCDGGTGNDVLDGGKGNDTLSGGEGNDIYLFDIRYGNDVIIGSSTNNNDILSFGTGITLSSKMDFLQSGNDLVVTQGNDNVNLMGWFESSVNRMGTFQFGRLKYLLGDNLNVGASGGDSLTANANKNSLLIGLDGNDTFSGNSGSDALFGGGDNDVLDGGGGKDLLMGGSGNDSVVGGWDADSLYGGLGNDTLVYDSKDTVLDGGEGFDILEISDMTGKVSVTLNASKVMKGMEGLKGNSFANLLGGDSLSNTLWGGADNDTLRGFAGNDVLFGEIGNDFLEGGVGSDTLIGGIGNDTLVYDALDSMIGGSEGIDVLSGATAVSKIAIDLNTDVYSGIEIVVGSKYDDVLIGLDDMAVSLFGGNGKDNLRGGNEGDFLDGGIGNDTIDGGIGDDTIVYGAGDMVNGGGGWDILNAQRATSAATINMSSNYSGIEQVLGSSFADKITGSNIGNVLSGGKGKDTLYSGLGNDTITYFAGDGQDVILASGNDILVFGNDIQPVSTVLKKQKDDLLLTISAKDSILLKNWFIANDETERLHQFYFGDVNYEVCNDTGNIYFQPAGIESMLGNDANNILTGNEMDEALLGYGSNDVLDGKGGNDSLYGGTGNDTLEGAGGNDILSGGEGTDVYLFGSSGGNDSISGTVGNYLDEVNFGSGITKEQLAISLSGNDLHITVQGSNDSLVVQDWNDGILYKLNKFIINGQTYFTDGNAWQEPTQLSNKLAYLSDRNGNVNVYTTESNDTHALRINPNDDALSYSVQPAWSPDGSQLAYAGDGGNVYVINATGSGNIINLTPLMGGSNSEPAWSPGGGRIIYNHASNYGFTSDLYVVGLDGQGFMNKTNSPDPEYNPIWSPDGTKLAYVSYAGGFYNIYVQDMVKGGSPQRLNISEGNFNQIAWSPDGSKIACVNTGTNQIFSMNVDGSGEQQLTTQRTNEHYAHPVWSPDGVRLAYQWGSASTIEQITNWEIYVMNEDGSRQTQLTLNGASDRNPVWSPDGTQIAFESYRQGNWDIYIMDRAGVSQLAVTTNPGSDTNPVWQPLATGNPFYNFRVIEGNDAGEALTGGSTSDIMFGFGGNDTLHGGSGSDTLFGGSGTDVLYGNEGNDWLTGEAYRDTLYGGEGEDTLVGDGQGVMYGGAGNDVYVVSFNEVYNTPVLGSDINNANDTLRIQSASPMRMWHEQSGNDLHLTNCDYYSDLYLKDWARGGGYQLNNFRFGDAIYQLQGNDWQFITSLSTNDDHHNTREQALVVGNDSNLSSVIDYQGDTDWFIFTPSKSGTYNLRGNTDLFVDILDNAGNAISDWRKPVAGENENGFLANGVMQAGQAYYVHVTAKDPIKTGAYALNLQQQTATDGNDFLHGSIGSDEINGLGGNDTIVHWYGSMFGGSDTLRGDDGNDSITMGGNHLWIDGGNDSDAIGGAMDNSTVYGGAGSDNLGAVYGTNDYIDGGSGDDLLGGDDTACTLLGGAGDDTITLWNEASQNVLQGGSGNDVYVIQGKGRSRTGPAKNHINNYAAAGSGNDTLEIYTDYRKSDFTYSRTGNDLLMRYQGNDFLTVDHWFDGMEYQLQQITFESIEDGGIVTKNDINSKFPENSFDITFNYEYASSFFTPEVKANLEFAANLWERVIQDDFASVPAGTALSIRDPRTSNFDSKLSITSGNDIDDIVIYVGTTSLDALHFTGLGGPSAWYFGGSSLETRWNSTTAFQPWVGSVSFDDTPQFSDGTPSVWFIDPTPEVADDVATAGNNQCDFITVACHEIGHVLGISDGIGAWDQYISQVSGNNVFTGSHAIVNNNGQSVPLIDRTHPNGGALVATGSTTAFANNQEPVMAYGISSVGHRLVPTSLELGMLQDLGYSIDYSKQYRV